jgi:hypothetical protein
MKRIESFGQEHLKQTREESRISLDPDAWRSEKLTRWQSFVKGIIKKEDRFTSTCLQRNETYSTCFLMDEHGLKPEGSCWLDVRPLFDSGRWN